MIAQALLVALGFIVGSVVLGLRRLRANRRVRALAALPPVAPSVCTLGVPEGQRLLEQVESLIAQLEPAATSGEAALIGSAGEGGVGDSIQRALEECARDWASTLARTDGNTAQALRTLGLTAHGAQDVSDRVANRTRDDYRAALEYFTAARTRLTADVTLGLYR